MDPHNSSFYARLGISKEANLEQVRRAYAQAVRKYTPEHAPEEFKRIREAYDTLKDPAARKTYDATSDPAVKALVEAGQEALDNERYDDASAAFKRALVLSPGAMYVRNLLGLSRMYAGDFKTAREQFERLTEEDGENSAVWQNLGTAEAGLEDWTSAENAFRRAVSLEPEDSDARVGLARTLAAQGDYEGAVSFLEESILYDGVVDFDDLSYFLGLIDLHLRQANHEAIEETARRLQGVLYEGWQRERVAHHLAGTAATLASVGAYDLAYTLAKESQVLMPDDRQIRGLRDAVFEEKQRFDEFERLMDASGVRPILKHAIGALMAVRFGTWDSEEEKRERLSEAIGVLIEQASLVYFRGQVGRSFAEELLTLKSNYPRLLSLIPEGVRREAPPLSLRPKGALIECDICQKAARAPLTSGRYSCPGCGKGFLLDAQGRTVSAVDQEAGMNWGCMIMVILFLLFLALSGL